jgi:PST family polysaccharide transporter
MSFLVTLILARLLSPDAFGLLGMVTVFTGFIAIFKDLGLGSSIVQDLDVDQAQLSSLYWMNAIFAFLLLLITVAIAPLVATFYEQPAVAPIMMALSISFPLSALSMVHTALLRKQLRFRELAIVQNLATGIGGFVGVLMAFMGLGVWALVAQQLTNQFVKMVMEWRVVSWRPELSFSIRNIGAQLNFGITLQIGSVLVYSSRNVDDFLIGKVSGASVLGIYQMAYRLMLWPLQRVSNVIGQVMFPALSAIQKDKQRVKHAFLRAISVIALVTFPMVLGMWVVSRSAITVILGEKWTEVIPIFQVLCILGLVQSISTNTGWIFLSQGRTDVRLKLLGIFSVFYIASFVIGIQWGAMGVAICYTLVSIALTPFQLHVAGRLIDMSVKDVLEAVANIFACAAGMAILVLCLQYILPVEWPDWAFLLVQVPAGAAVYLALLHLFDVETYREARRYIRRNLKNWNLKHPKTIGEGSVGDNL